jgi:hypothetical protein
MNGIKMKHKQFWVGRTNEKCYYCIVLNFATLWVNRKDVSSIFLNIGRMLLTWTFACLFYQDISISLFKWSLSICILWWRVCGNIPGGIQHYLSMYIYTKEWPARVDALQIWIQPQCKQNQILFVCAKDSIPIFRTNDRCISRLSNMYFNVFLCFKMNIFFKIYKPLTKLWKNS